MKVKEIRFIDKIKDIYNDNVDVAIEMEDGYTYILTAATPQDLLEAVKHENYIQPNAVNIIVKELTEEIIAEAIQAYAENNQYWLKLYQFADSDIDISVLDKAQQEHKKELKELDQLEDD